MGMTLRDRQAGIVAAVILPDLISSTVVFSRSLRKVKRRPLYISRSGVYTAEVLMILSVVSAWVSGAFVLVSVPYGFGRHMTDIVAEPNGEGALVQAVFWQIMGYPFNIGCYCLSVAGQVMHYRTWLFDRLDSQKTVSRIMNASGIIQVLLMVLCMITIFAKCQPVQANWDPSVQGTCWSNSVFFGFNYTSSAVTFVSYMIQSWVPIHLALSLDGNRISMCRWITLIVLAFWNVLAGVLALIKIRYLHLYTDMDDPTYSRVPLVIIGLCENGASGIVPSTAELWALAQQLTKRPNAKIESKQSNIRPALETSSSHESEQELQRVQGEGEQGDRIIKTVAWETAVSQPRPHSWSEATDCDESVSCERERERERWRNIGAGKGQSDCRIGTS